MRVLNFGSINIDLVYEVDHIVLPGETISSSAFARFAGGKGANQSVALAKAGLEVWHAGRIGADGQWVLDLLGEYGVTTDLVTVDDGETGNAMIQVASDGNNSIVLTPGGNRRIAADAIARTISRFDKGDLLVLQNEVNDVSEMIRYGSERGLRVCLNPAPFTNEIRDWPLASLHMLVVNEIEAEQLAGTTPNGSVSHSQCRRLVDRLVREFKGVRVVLTAGSGGAFYGYGDERHYAEAKQVDAVDTTAAGDTFTGFFLASLEDGMDVPTSMDRASRASAIAVSRKGAMDSIPTKNELDPGAAM